MKYPSTLATAAMFLVALTMLLPSPCQGQKRIWRAFQSRSVISFDWNCARKESFPAAALTKIVYRSLNPDDRGRAWVDRAFTFSLQHRGPVAYFVPTVCGATGNCTWRIYTLGPLRYLGEISGQFIYVYKSSGLPVIVTYTHMSASEGILATYVIRHGRYRWLGDEYPIGYEIRPGLRTNGYKMPPYFERAVRQCKDYGA